MSKVKCELCEKKYEAKGGIVTHLKSCLNKGGFGDYLMLKVSDPDNRDYFLYLLIDEEETLCTLDLFMKAIWLECCGHLSQFYIHPHSPKYTQFNNMEYHGPIYTILSEGITIHYDYDFGSTTTLEIECLKEMVGFDSDEPVVLLARNENPSKNKDNSPRAGICGYQEDINYRMTFLKQFQDYRNDRLDMEAYTCHEITEEFANQVMNFSDLEEEFDTMDLEEFDSELEAMSMAYELKIDNLMNKYSKQINANITLREALERLNKQGIVNICRSHGLLPYSRQTKSELVNRLVNELPSIFKESLSMYDHNQLEMYSHLNVNKIVLKEDLDIMSKNDLFFLESSIRHFVWFGSDNDDELVFVIPIELQEILDDLDLKAFKLRAQSNTKIIKYVKGLLNLYGVLEKNDLYNHLCHYLGFNIESEEVYKIVSNACYFYKDISDFGTYYSWREMDDAEEILEERALNPTITWKELTSEEVEKAGEEFYYPDIEGFKKLGNLMIEHTEIPVEGIDVILNSIFELTTRFTNPEIIISYLVEIFSFESINKKLEIEIINAFENSYNNCGMRVYKGYSVNEME